MTNHITKTWFDGKTVVTVTKEIPLEEVYKREWVGLTDAERDSVLDSVPPDNLGGEYYDKEITAIAVAIEAKLKEKNA